MAKLTDKQKSKAKGIKAARMAEFRTDNGRKMPKQTMSKPAMKKKESPKKKNMFTERVRRINTEVNRAVKGSK